MERKKEMKVKMEMGERCSCAPMYFYYSTVSTIFHITILVAR